MRALVLAIFMALVSICLGQTGDKSETTGRKPEVLVYEFYLKTGYTPLDRQITQRKIRDSMQTKLQNIFTLGNEKSPYLFTGEAYPPCWRKVTYTLSNLQGNQQAYIGSVELAFTLYDTRQQKPEFIGKAVGIHCGQIQESPDIALFHAKHLPCRGFKKRANGWKARTRS